MDDASRITARVHNLHQAVLEAAKLRQPDWLNSFYEHNRMHNLAGRIGIFGTIANSPAYNHIRDAGLAYQPSPALEQMRAHLATDHFHHHDRLLKAISSRDLVAQLGGSDVWNEANGPIQRWVELASAQDSLVCRHAEQAATLAATLHLPDHLESYRVGEHAMLSRLTAGVAFQLTDVGAWKQPAYIAQFAAAAATANALSGMSSVGQPMRECLNALRLVDMPTSLGLAGYGKLLDMAGFTLTRWPQIWRSAFRLPSAKQRAARQRGRLQALRQPLHIGHAKSLVHQHESYLRLVIDEAMTLEYGVDWPDERLGLCGEKGRDLLGRWKKRGGNPLQHADYPHYVVIMVQADHYEAIFRAGFQDPIHIIELLERARKLRAGSHHAHNHFTKEDLRELRGTWNAITKGLRPLDEMCIIALDEECDGFG